MIWLFIIFFAWLALGLLFTFNLLATVAYMLGTTMGFALGLACLLRMVREDEGDSS